MSGLDNLEALIRQKALELGQAAEDIARELLARIRSEPTPAELAPYENMTIHVLRALHYIYYGTSAGNITRNALIRKVYAGKLMNQSRETLARNLKKLSGNQFIYVAQRLRVPDLAVIIEAHGNQKNQFIDLILDQFYRHYS